jgi:hypothetical protein
MASRTTATCLDQPYTFYTTRQIGLTAQPLDRQ